MLQHQAKKNKTGTRQVLQCLTPVYVLWQGRALHVLVSAVDTASVFLLTLVSLAIFAAETYSCHEHMYQYYADALFHCG